MAKCVEYKGQLVIVDDWSTHYTEPLAMRSYWPTGLSAKDYSMLINKPARYLGLGGIYQIGDLKVALIHGEHTKPIYTETEKLKKPRWAKCYKNGQWRNHY